MRAVPFMVFAAVLGASSPVWADIAPPPGYVEQCSVSKQQKAGETCTVCGVNAQDDPDSCQKLHAGDGACRRCSTRGGTFFDEIWCSPDGRLVDSGARSADGGPDGPSTSTTPGSSAPPLECPGTSETASSNAQSTSSDGKGGGCAVAPGSALAPWLMALGVPLLLRRRRK